MSRRRVYRRCGLGTRPCTRCWDGRRPDIGDLDSVSAAGLAKSRGIPIEQYPDQQGPHRPRAALEAATRLDADRIVVVGGHGGRVDHFLGNVAAIASPEVGHCGRGVDLW